LDRARSFLLDRRPLGNDAGAALAQVASALDAFRAYPADPRLRVAPQSVEGLLLQITPPAALPTLVATLSSRWAEAMSTAIPMYPPPVPKGMKQMELRGEDGLGSWLPLVSILAVELHASPASILDLPVAQGLALLAGVRRSQGWSFPGGGYLGRERRDAAAKARSAATPRAASPMPVNEADRAVDRKTSAGDQDHQQHGHEE